MSQCPAPKSWDSKNTGGPLGPAAGPRGPAGQRGPSFQTSRLASTELSARAVARRHAVLVDRKPHGPEELDRQDPPVRARPLDVGQLRRDEHVSDVGDHGVEVRAERPHHPFTG
eukprot:6323090-Pyramimonas_sp.AAC.1